MMFLIASVWLLAYCIATNALSTNSSTVSLREITGLRDLYFATNGTNWNYKYPLSVYGAVWNFTVRDNLSQTDPCKDLWQGIYCYCDTTVVKNLTSNTNITTNSSCYITDIDLTKYNLIGTIPNSISLLSRLESLTLSSTRLSGSIPPAIASLPSLPD